MIYRLSLVFNYTRWPLDWGISNTLAASVSNQNLSLKVKKSKPKNNQQSPKLFQIRQIISLLYFYPFSIEIFSWLLSVEHSYQLPAWHYRIRIDFFSNKLIFLICFNLLFNSSVLIDIYGSDRLSTLQWLRISSD